ncbi:SAF domain-containing protein [Aeromicrobium sp. CTD01-1L150]|uniref:SAF domain-containing protein n=1 Tax=Aeromicrobium sp. CTD01-1L150 TaxID=3341830 RepID=UPI0035C137D5
MAKTATRAQVSRLPSTRESRPALIGLAIVLIVGGALASGWLAIQSGNRAFFVQASQEVAQGAQITSDDLTRVSLPEDFDGAIPADDVDDIVGQSATTRLLPGTVLTPEMVSEDSGVAANQTQLTLSVDASPFIQRLQAGAQLALNVGGGDSGRQAVAAELVSVGDADDGGLGQVSGDEIPIVVAIDLSCLSTVAQGIEDNAVTPALIGGDAGQSVPSTCGG